MKAVILAGGRGTRLAPYTTILPKPLMPVGEQPILDIVISQLRHYGITDIILAVGHLAELLMAYFGDGSKHGVKLSYSREDQPLGTAGPLGLVGELAEPFLVMNGDVLTTLPFGDLICYHAARKAIATIAACQREIKIDLGVLGADGNDTLTQYIEKPIHTYMASMGIYVFQPEVLHYIPNRSRLDLPDLVRNLMDQGHRVSVYRFAGYWLDIGRYDDYARAVEEFKAMRPELLHEDKLEAAQ